MRLGIDVGGTFTDLLLRDDEKNLTFQAKTPSTPEDQSIGILNGVKLICGMADVDPSRVELILHGTTVATNAVLEGKGSRVGLLLTKGFEYTLHLAKSWTPGPLFGWIIMDKPDPLAALDDTRGIAERMDAQGRVIEPLDIEQATQAIDALCASGIEALTISLMHAYANDAHEQALKRIVEARYPDIPVSLSSEILPEFREYDRAITTVMNAYVRPIMRRYLSNIETRLADNAMTSRLHIVRSDGGLMSAATASERPVHTVLSGPAGGVISTAKISQATGLGKLLAFDMGGTSTDVSVVLDGQPTISRSTEVGFFPAKVPTMDVRSVGAGGGSIAEVAELTRSLKVGPRSAGAKPGPACYGRGGTEATVSDANAALGYLPPKLLGGSMSLDVPAAQIAVGKIGERLGLSAEDAATGILRIANEVMLGALRVVTVQRGLDPRDFGIVAFGGAGPLHANAMADVLGCYPVVVPTHPGVLSAQGFVQAEFKNEFVQTFIRPAAEVAAGDLKSRFADLTAKAERWLEAEMLPPEERRITYSIDMRYEQQGFEVVVDFAPAAALSGDPQEAITAFHDLHERLYGVRFDVPVEFVALRVTASAAGVTMADEIDGSAAPGSLDDALVERRRCYFDGAWVDTPNYDRGRLKPGHIVEGPAIIVQYDTTTVLLPRHWAEIDRLGNILIWPNTKAR
jgi:N-methylhydantoinase A